MGRSCRRAAATISSSSRLTRAPPLKPEPFGAASPSPSLMTSIQGS